MSRIYFPSVTATVVVLLACVYGLVSPVAKAAENCDTITCSKDSQDETTYIRCNQEKQACLEKNISEVRGQAITLSNTINLLNDQIKIQQLQIDQTTAEITSLEKQIVDLSNRIEGLNVSLDHLSHVLVSRINEQYKVARTNPPVMLMVADSFGEFLTNFKLLRLTQAQTIDAMQQAETQKTTYDEQKALKEEKQTEVEQKKSALVSQQQVIARQRSDQQFLLQSTRNDEARYQRELEKTLAELEAIQSIIAGRGNETEAGSIGQGDRIASIIVGASACSTGTHLHLEVVKDGAHRDPSGFLKSIDAQWNNQPDGSFGFGGDWDWPLNNPAKINQGYGMTYYARVKRSYGGAPHTGIDMASKSEDYTVKAIKPGKLYRGSIPCGGGLLRYVKVEHQDDGYQTYYLHVNY